MLAAYLRRGVAAGVVAGFCYAIYLLAVGNPLTAYVASAAHDHGHAHDAAGSLSTVTTQAVSAGSGLLWAILLGGLFGLAMYFVEPALPGRGAVSAFVLAGAGFLTVSGTPWLVLPPAAPGAEQFYGVDTRLTIYAALVALGALLSALAVTAYSGTAPRSRAFGIAAGAVPVLALAVVIPLATPTVTTNPELPATLVTAYQALVVLSQAALWAVIAGAFAWLHRPGGLSQVDSAQPTLR